MHDLGLLRRVYFSRSVAIHLDGVIAIRESLARECVTDTHRTSLRSTNATSSDPIVDKSSVCCLGNLIRPQLLDLIESLVDLLLLLKVLRLLLLAAHRCMKTGTSCTRLGQHSVSCLLMLPLLLHTVLV